jgi:hypothetical protein
MLTLLQLLRCTNAKLMTKERENTPGSHNWARMTFKNPNNTKKFGIDLSTISAPGAITTSTCTCMTNIRHFAGMSGVGELTVLSS